MKFIVDLWIIYTTTVVWCKPVISCFQDNSLRKYIGYMTSQRDIYASAQALIKEYGQEAEEIAYKRMIALMEQNDAKGSGVWLSIMSAIEDLRQLDYKGRLN